MNVYNKGAGLNSFCPQLNKRRLCSLFADDISKAAAVASCLGSQGSQGSQGSPLGGINCYRAYSHLPHTAGLKKAGHVILPCIPYLNSLKSLMKDHTSNGLFELKLGRFGIGLPSTIMALSHCAEIC